MHSLLTENIPSSRASDSVPPYGTSVKIEMHTSHHVQLQSDLKEQELRNERLSVKLQQRPEADDVRAMQQQLSFLHILMEKNSTDHEQEMERVKEEGKVMVEEKKKLQREYQELEKSLEGNPKVEDVKK